MANDESDSRRLRRAIDEDIIRAKQALSLYQKSESSGVASADVEETLRHAAIDLYNSLKPWRDDPQVNDTWDEYDLRTFGRLLSERVQVGQSGESMLGVPGESTTRLRVAELNPHQLEQVIEGLMAVAKDLGLTVETNERTVLEKGTIEDVRWLLSARNQDKALDELEPPENDPDAVTDGGVATAAPGSVGPDLDPGTEPARRYPFRGPFFQLIAERKDQGKDAKIAVSSANAETGVGKSTFAYYLAHVLDTSAAGYVVDDKATLDVGSFLQAYDELPKGSALILDEAEQLTGRRAMAKKNVKAGERWQMRRVAEICSLLTLPKFSVLDPLMKDLVDFRIEIERRGLATIYKKSHRPFGDTWWQAIQQFEYPAMDDTAGMERLHEMKEEFNETNERAVVSESQAQAEAEKEAENARRADRDRTIQRLDEQGLTQQDIADELAEIYGEDSDLAVSRRRVGDILKEASGG